MPVVSQIVRQIRHLRLQTGFGREQNAIQRRHAGSAVLDQPLPRRNGQVDPIVLGILDLQMIDHPQRLQIVVKTAVVRHDDRHRPFARVTEGRMPQIMRQRDRFRQIDVQRKRVGDRLRNGSDLDGMGQTVPQVVPRSAQKNLRFVLQTPERTAVQNTIPVSLKVRAERVDRLGMATARCRTLRTDRVGRK